MVLNDGAFQAADKLPFVLLVFVGYRYKFIVIIANAEIIRGFTRDLCFTVALFWIVTVGCAIENKFPVLDGLLVECMEILNRIEHKPFVQLANVNPYVLTVEIGTRAAKACQVL